MRRKGMPNSENRISISQENPFDYGFPCPLPPPPHSMNEIKIALTLICYALLDLLAL